MTPNLTLNRNNKQNTQTKKEDDKEAVKHLLDSSGARGTLNCDVMCFKKAQLALEELALLANGFKAVTNLLSLLVVVLKLDY